MFLVGLAFIFKSVNCIFLLVFLKIIDFCSFEFLEGKEIDDDLHSYTLSDGYLV